MKVVWTTLLLLLVSGCNGGKEGNTSVGGIHFTHEELAHDFVDSVNRYLGHEFDLELVKVETEKHSYIVVFNNFTEEYEAYWLYEYNPGESIDEYLNKNRSRFYYDLERNGDSYWKWKFDHLTREWVKIRFAKAQETTKDLTLINALHEKLTIDNLSKKLQLQLSMSAERSHKWAEAMYFVNQTDSITPEQVDNISNELLGFKVTDLNKAFQNSDTQTIHDKIKRAGELNDGMSPEQVNSILSSLF